MSVSAVLFGLLFVAIGFAFAYAARILFTAPKKEAPRPVLSSIALKSSPLLALLFTALLGMLGTYVLFYSLIVLVIVLGARLSGRRTGLGAISFRR